MDNKVILSREVSEVVNLIKGKTYKWTYIPVNLSFRDSKCVCEYIGKFTGEYDELFGFARMALLDDIGGYILADTHSLHEL